MHEQNIADTQLKSKSERMPLRRIQSRASEKSNWSGRGSELKANDALIRPSENSQNRSDDLLKPRTQLSFNAAVTIV